MQTSDAANALKRIYPGDTIRVLTDAEGKLDALSYEINHESYLMAQRDAGVLTSAINEYETESRVAHANGEIESSLFLAAADAGISQNVIMELAGIFGWDIDFVLDIRKGDTFSLMYEELYRNGEKIADGDILAAEFINDGKSYKAVRYVNPQTNQAEYFSPEGKSMRKAFLRSPVNFTRISSKFTTGRYHPILHKIRAHKGVDYAAKRGTPIRAAGDGKIIHRANKGGYGRTVIIQHGSKYSTLYAHLNSYKKGQRVGAKVKQGQIIGYLGSSGLATGPHLHYEFRVNGVHRNPLTVRLPIAQPVPERYKLDFEVKTKPVLAQLELFGSTQLASN
jgi:murein DD-endopeptidase MepM/ murein hydrolase activator NlpD